MQVNPAAIVARVNFYGWSLSGKRSLAEFFVNNLSNERTVNGFTDVIFCPMLVNHLGRILIKMLERGLHGLYHVVGPQAMSKYQFGVEIARKFGLAGKPDSTAICGQIKPDCPSFPQFMAFHPQVVHRITPTLSRLFHRTCQFYTQFQQGYPQKIRSYQQK